MTPTRFIDRAIADAGLLPLAEARRAGNMEVVRANADVLRDADLLVLGAIADGLRAAEVGDVVRIHHGELAAEVVWVSPPETAGGAGDLDALREVALMRILSPRETCIGVDWSRLGLELAQVALGFGASELRGSITKKNGLPILASDARKVRGAKLVDLASIKRREIAALVRNAGRVPSFTDERLEGTESLEESGSRLAQPEDIRVRLHP